MHPCAEPRRPARTFVLGLNPVGRRQSAPSVCTPGDRLVRAGRDVIFGSRREKVEHASRASLWHGVSVRAAALSLGGNGVLHPNR